MFSNLWNLTFSLCYDDIYEGDWWSWENGCRPEEPEQVWNQRNSPNWEGSTLLDLINIFLFGTVNLPFIQIALRREKMGESAPFWRFSAASYPDLDGAMPLDALPRQMNRSFITESELSSRVWHLYLSIFKQRRHIWFFNAKKSKFSLLFWHVRH